MMRYFFIVFLLFIIGCSPSVLNTSDTRLLDRSLLPRPDITVTIPNISTCTDSDEKSVNIDSKSPLAVLVHGCNGSAGRFRALAQLYAFNGQQSVCFSYNDRDSIEKNAEKLTYSIGELSEVMDNDKISILGHSMGGLISRKALELGYKKDKPKINKNLELITISALFAGIDAANHCGIRPLHWISLGIVPGFCWIVTGDNWYEITSYSDLIKAPSPLMPAT